MTTYNCDCWSPDVVRGSRPFRVLYLWDWIVRWNNTSVSERMKQTIDPDPRNYDKLIMGEELLFYFSKGPGRSWLDVEFFEGYNTGDRDIVLCMPDDYDFPQEATGIMDFVVFYIRYFPSNLLTSIMLWWDGKDFHKFIPVRGNWVTKDGHRALYTGSDGNLDTEDVCRYVDKENLILNDNGKIRGFKYDMDLRLPDIKLCVEDFKRSRLRSLLLEYGQQ